MTYLPAICIVLFYVGYAGIYAGWLFHRSLDPVLFGYSLAYLAFLVVMATPFLVPVLARAMRKRLDPRAYRFTVITVLGFCVLVYVVAAQFYYQTQRHRFDPFLQVARTRFDPGALAREPDTLRIITMGGSTTRSAHLPPDERYPSVLETVLEAESAGRRVEVLNAGMEWWSTKHSLINYVTYLRRLNPDVVVIMHAINDAMRSFSPPQYAIGEYDEQWSHYYGAAIQGAVPPSFEKKWLARLASPWYPQRGRVVEYPRESFVSLPVYRQHLATLFEYLEADGVRAILVTEPSIYTDEMVGDDGGFLSMTRAYFRQRGGPLRFVYPDAPSMRRAMEMYNAAAVAEAWAHGVNVVDAAAQIPRERAYFVDDVHATAAHARLLAELVADAVNNAVALSAP
jgi:lysophospholipase L1-like esterase